LGFEMERLVIFGSFGLYRTFCGGGFRRIQRETERSLDIHIFLTAFYCFAFHMLAFWALDFFLELKPRVSIFTDIYIYNNFSNLFL
jgi:hypothetical protein